MSDEWVTDKRSLAVRALERRREESAFEKKKPGPRAKRGFATIPRERLKDLARSGGRASVALGKAHQFTHEEAMAAGSKGGTAKAKADHEPLTDYVRRRLGMAGAVFVSAEESDGYTTIVAVVEGIESRVTVRDLGFGWAASPSGCPIMRNEVVRRLLMK